MVGVGSGSALNAFNIGQAATTPTAVGQQITAIVEEGSKKGLLEAQSGAQAAGGIAAAQYKQQQEQNAPDIKQYTNDPITNELIDLGYRPATSKFQAQPLSESFFKAKMEQEYAAEDAKALAAEDAKALADKNAGGNVQNVGANPNVSPFSVGGQGAPAPVATPGTQQLKSPEFQGLDPAIFQTPEGQAALRRIIDEKIRAAGGGGTI